MVASDKNWPFVTDNKLEDLDLLNTYLRNLEILVTGSKLWINNRVGIHLSDKLSTYY